MLGCFNNFDCFVSHSCRIDFSSASNLIALACDAQNVCETVLPRIIHHYSLFEIQECC